MRKTIFDIPIDWMNQEELERKLKLFVVGRKPHQITTVNPEFVVMSQHNREFKQILQASDLSLADGTGIVLAQTFFDSITSKNKLIRWVRYSALGFRFLIVPHSFSYKRITGVDLSETLMRLSSEEKWSVFLLGSAPGTAQKAALMWQAHYPDLKIVGASSSNPQDAHTISEVKKANPDVLLVAYGAPKQDLFIAQHKDELKIPIMVGVGGTFDYLAGTIKRPPTWFRFLGLEWLARLIQQPKRFKRIWRSTLTFSRIIISNKI